MVRELRYLLTFTGSARPEDMMGEVMLIEAEAEGAEAPFAGRARFSSRVETDSENEFRETGEIVFPEGTLRFSSEGYGRITPSADEAKQHGRVTWTIEGGSGAFAGASGFILSNFTVSEDAKVTDSQAAVVFVP
ncbi:hypothetical protein ACSHT0_10135 [Tepidicaulis sp. LMO-SS28]|uniref:hypothetical protein n=1 Tax=Tepidicaulis sp. LMO-SS28 TaxID=3447455 RepID=UPI003EDF0028